MQPDAHPLSSTAVVRQQSRKLAAAHFWASFGYIPMPFRTGEKRPMIKRKQWLEIYSEDSITAMWEAHPEADIAALLDDRSMVLDADTPAAEVALRKLLQEHRISNALEVKSQRGSHIHVRLAQGTYARNDSHDTAVYPERIDVKTKGGLILLPPSTNKTLVTRDIKRFSQLPEVGLLVSMQS